MAKRRKKAGAFNPADIANIVQSNPYVQSVVSDAKLRKNVTTAVNSGKRAYGRIANGKTPLSLLEDKKLHGEVGRALGAARDATITLTRIQGRQARKRLSAGKAVVIATAGGAVALAVNEKLRSKVLDVLFGAEEEFQYTPPSNSSPAQSSSTVGAA
jgi:hypothetical protein